MGGAVALRGKAGQPQWQVPFGITCLALPLSRFSLPHALRCAPRPGRLSALSVTQHSRSGHASEKDAKLAQKLGQLQPFIAVFPQECMRHLHLLGQPNTFFARDGRGLTAGIPDRRWRGKLLRLLTRLDFSDRLEPIL